MKNWHFVSLITLVAGMIYLLCAAGDASPGYYSTKAAVWSWWHPAVAAFLGLAEGAAIVVWLALKPPPELTPDEADLLKRYRKGGL